MALSPARRVLRPVGVALAIAVAVACSPSRAVAECGDYVHIVKDDTTTTPASPTPDRRPLLPCTGPNCSSRPTAPEAPLAPPTTAPVVAEEWAVQTASAKEPDGRSGWCQPAASDRLPARVPVSIFHPPRAS